MVKKWIAIGTILILLVVGCALEYRFVNGSFDYLYKELAEFQSMLEGSEENIDTLQNIEYIESIHKKWHKKVEVLKALIWHTNLKDLEVGLSRIETYTSENDFTEAMTELEALIDYVDHFSKDFDFSLQNLLAPKFEFFRKIGY